MLRKSLLLAAAFGLMVSACGGGGAGSCEEVADDAINVIQELLDEASTMSEDEFSAGADEFFAGFEQKAEEIEVQIDKLGCSSQQMDTLMSERAGNLTIDDAFTAGLLSELGEAFFE